MGRHDRLFLLLYKTGRNGTPQLQTQIEFFERLYMDSYRHLTVFLLEAINASDLKTGDIAVDCTFGGGGHTRSLLEAVGKSGKVVAFDRDLDAITNGQRTFSEDIESGRLVLVQAPFSECTRVLENLGLRDQVQYVLADIGVSSHQIDTPQRGFSFQSMGPLDMRMDQLNGESAGDFINQANETEIADVIFRFGEEPKSRRIAKAIVTKRASNPFKTTRDLAQCIEQLNLWGGRPSKTHPATRTFQALRIYVNRELEELELLLKRSFDFLPCGARLGIITFHSLEDRIAKQFMKQKCLPFEGRTIPREIPIRDTDAISKPAAKIIGQFPTSPSEAEVKDNPRSRSAKLRVIQKLV